MSRSTDNDADAHAELITRLVDDAVEGDDGARAQAWLHEHPEAEGMIAAQRRVVAELRGAGPEVPDHLVGAIRDKVTAAYGPAAASGRSRSTARTRRSTGRSFAWRPMVLGPAAVCAVAIVALVIAFGGGSGTSAPSIVRAAQLAYAPSQGPAPAARDARYLDVSYGGVTFPNYASAFDAVPVGRRLDRLGGRPALTIFYRLRDGTRLSYTVFSGQAVPRPGIARVVVFDGVRLHVFVTSSHLAVVTLVRHGRTCVLAAPTTQDAVLALAAEPVHAAATA